MTTSGKKISKLARSTRNYRLGITRTFLKEQKAVREAVNDVVSVERVEVHGKLVRSVGYDPETQTLQIQFPGGLYDYLNVREARYQQFMESEDADAFFHDNIKSHYIYQRSRRR